MFDRLNQGIYWDKFWPLVDGCTPAGPECDRCWRATYQHRFDKDHILTTDDGKFFGSVEIRKDKINLPLHTKKPKVWFVLNDLFHRVVPAELIVHAYEVMAEAKQHIFIVCTKRPERIVPVLYDTEGGFYLGGGDYIPNIWHMTTAGNQEMADKRIPELLKLRQASPGWPVLGVSVEPMLGPVDLTNLRTEVVLPPTGNQLDWVILGGESGPGARPMNPEWPRKVRDDCHAADVPFLFKQWGDYREFGCALDGHPMKEAGWKPEKHGGRMLDGRIWNYLPKLKNQ